MTYDIDKELSEMTSFQTHEGRVAVVTGAGRGIGQAIARQLGERGATVVAVDLRAPEETVALVTENGGTAVGLTADVSSQEQTAAVGAEVARRFGRADILVNNAGIFPFQDIAELEYEAWRRVLAVNLDSQFFMVKALLSGMKERGWGRIVNLTSNSIISAAPGLTHYMASKMGIIGFTRGLANDLAPFGITVNAVGPSLTRTPGVLQERTTDDIEQVAQLQAIKRIAEPEDVVGTILYLTSDDATFVTGQTIMADGGYAR
ncbi:SDR family NAD(P)-dependent oxidoreductase [Micromonospora krabiensis]|uniref:3-oxoacyl-[acyl-carrier protein] reductase n=1 Tax=Micromonospora krabiensis TaxID=307121 RepID=A0A1C3MXU9_9ACTN|nr:SDR family NAD(P)-dependent oxidoreductase [Micromonospora krabiensis]SBV25149.1 3-oxoacyl-[acyl-carrier protein] reductase [Micromonospora krabiensis]